jgi:hypothetical protein
MAGVKTIAAAALLALAPSDGAVLVTADGASRPARDVTLVVESGELAVRYAEPSGARRTLKAADLVELSFEPSAAPPPARPAPEDVEIHLTNGDVLTGKVAGKSEEGVPLANKTFGDPLVKFSRIRALLFPANRAFLPRTPPAKADDADIVLTQSGDRAEGTVLSISPAGLVYKSKRLEAEVSLPLAQVAGVWLVEWEKPPAEPPTLFVTVATRDGSSLRGEVRSLREGVLEFKDLYGTEHRIPAGAVSSIFVKNGRVVYLSDLSPSAVEEDANYIRGLAKSPSDLEYPFQRDRSARGTKIVLGGVEHRKGLGVRAHSSLTYALDETFQKFQATFGLDAVSMGLGSVLGEVWVDGKKVLSLPLKGNDPPQPVDVNVRGARELRLVVTWNGHGQSDFAGWGSARLVR